MNVFVAAGLFDSPWVLAVIVLVGALSNWLMKRRQEHQAQNQPDGDAPQPSPGKPQEHPLPQFDLEEALRQLLGGERPPHAPPPPPPPPPIPPLRRDAQPSEVWSDQDQFQPEQTWLDEPKETYGAARPPAIPAAPPSRPDPALAQANATRIEASKRHDKAARRFEQLNEQARRPATALSAERGRRSRAGARAIELVRNARTVRQALIASQLLGPPKAFETSRL